MNTKTISTKAMLDLFDRAILEARNKMLASKAEIQKRVLDNSLHVIGDDLVEYRTYRELEDALIEVRNDFIDAIKETT